MYIQVTMCRLLMVCLTTSLVMVPILSGKQNKGRGWCALKGGVALGGGSGLTCWWCGCALRGVDGVGGVVCSTGSRCPG